MCPYKMVTQMFHLILCHAKMSLMPGGSWPQCTDTHTGLGRIWHETHFLMTRQINVDIRVLHSNTVQLRFVHFRMNIITDTTLKCVKMCGIKIKVFMYEKAIQQQNLKTT